MMRMWSLWLFTAAEKNLSEKKKKKTSKCLRDGWSVLGETLQIFASELKRPSFSVNSDLNRTLK